MRIVMAIGNMTAMMVSIAIKVIVMAENLMMVMVV